jgi:diaminopimelate decarboxylase
MVRAGARLTTAESGLWRKFGVPLERLEQLLATAAECSHVDLQGLQYHMSWSLDPAPQVAFIRTVGDSLARLPVALRRGLHFLDLGGGFWPPEGEWLHANPHAMQPAGPAVAASGANRATRPPSPLVRPASDIEDFADKIADALRDHLFPHIDCRIHVEPGRWLCNDAMHILLTVVDKKADDLVIVDAGTNAIGWERFESDYFPVVNLTRPAMREHVCTIFGSLCTPHDVWGFSYHGDGIEVGDVLLVPRQGAYTFSLRQEFIKMLPEVVVRAPTGWTR